MTMNNIDVFFAALVFGEVLSFESFKTSGQSLAKVKAEQIKLFELLCLNSNNCIEVSVRTFSL